MKLLTINADNVYLPEGELKHGVSSAASEARERGFQFFIYDEQLYLIAYWRTDPRPDYFQLETDPLDIVALMAEIKALD